MRKSLKNTDEVCHYWANQVQDGGYASNVSFQAKDFYSYRTIIARIVNDVVLYNTRSYSVTTSSHTSDLLSAARHKKQIAVYDVEYGIKDNKEVMQGEIKDYLKKASTARTQKEFYISQAIKTAENFNAYFDLMNENLEADTLLLRVNADSDYCKIDMEQFKDIDFTALKAAEKQRLALELAKRKEREAEYALENSIKIKQWLNGESYNLGYGVTSSTLLRVKGDVIETSRGAEIPLSDAPRLWALVQTVVTAGRGVDLNYKVGVYRLTAISPLGNITVGCHYIEYSELKRIALQLGYITE